LPVSSFLTNVLRPVGSDLESEAAVARQRDPIQSAGFGGEMIQQIDIFARTITQIDG
jgi:hypothetical protein